MLLYFKDQSDESQDDGNVSPNTSAQAIGDSHTFIASKAIIKAYYGSGPKLSVLNNSGGGGRQAVFEAQRYPADYDAIAVPGTIDVYATRLHFGDLGLSSNPQRPGKREKQTDLFRLFMVPGMGHQMGTNGVENFNFDSLKAVLDWKQTGKAPDQIIATRYKNGKEVGKRLICAYPRVAVYKGTGAPDDPANFVCKAPKP